MIMENDIKDNIIAILVTILFATALFSITSCEKPEMETERNQPCSKAIKDPTGGAYIVGGCD